MKYTDSYYEGEWKNDKKNGKGKMTWIDGKRKGDVYEGEFKDDYFHGKGVYIWLNGDVYDGEWNNGFRHGFGILKTEYDIYEGEWKNGKKDGKGKMTYKDKSKGIYEGNWKNDKKHGSGVRIEYGKRYKEEWHEGSLYVDNRWRKAGRILDDNGNVLGIIDSKGKLYDEIGYNIEGEVYDNGYWYNFKSNQKGYIWNNGEVRDDNNNRIGRFEED